MRHSRVIWTLIVGLMFGWKGVGAAQEASRPVILNVTMSAAGDELTISGRGFGPAPVVTIDGLPAAVLPGASDTQIAVVTPAALLTTPGTYRLTVVDSVRQVGEVFVVASRAGLVPAVSLATSEKSSAPGAAGGSMLQPRGSSAAFAASSTTGGGPVGISTVVEDSVTPFKTAIGSGALADNAAGGLDNTASGYQALTTNITGDDNTATGYLALTANATGSTNTASGAYALGLNTTGVANTASGAYALQNNTTSAYNTASGAYALRFNTTGSSNTASGASALYFNTTGSSNAAFGAIALTSNYSGSSNTAIGAGALQDIDTGSFNAALGDSAGSLATTGHYNVFLGGRVVGNSADTNTIRIGRTYNGSDVPASGQNATFIAGIRGTTVSGGFPVLIDANGQLGTADSSGSGNFGIGTATPLAKLDVRVSGIAPPSFSVTNTSPGGGTFGINAIGGAIGSLVAGDALMQNGVGNIVFSPNAAGKDVRFIGGVWTNPISMTVADGGNVGVGTTTPGAKLEVSTSGIAPASFNIVNTSAGGGRFGVNVIGGAIGSLLAGDALMQNGVGNIVFSPNSPGRDVRFIGGLWTNPVSMVVRDGGFVGIGTMTPSNPLEMKSGAYVSTGGVWTNASSRSLKDQIAELPLSRALEAIERLQPVTFVYKANPGEAHVGFIAEDVPDLVATTDRKSLAAMDIVAVLTKVVQDQRAQLEEDEETLRREARQLDDERAIVADLQARLARLEARLAPDPVR